MDELKAAGKIDSGMVLHDHQQIDPEQLQTLMSEIRLWADELGFSAVGFAKPDLAIAEQFLNQWLAANYHGEMEWMARHGSLRTQPEQLHPGTLSIISARMNYLGDTDYRQMEALLEDDQKGYVSRYALGRDYHKLMRKRLAQLAQRIQRQIGSLNYRVFTDSAPVMEKALAEQAGIGWIGKHTNLINSKAGSWFFLGEIYTNLPLVSGEPASNHCGSCTKCLEVCPTQAFVGPYQLDARRCISYLTIELDGPIPEPLRAPMGNRIYGCDDCQLVCPWNRFAQVTQEQDFLPRQGLESAELVDLFNWTETEFNTRLEGSPIRRIGHRRWIRNISVALGNSRPTDQADRTRLLQTLHSRLNDPSEMIKEHLEWAIRQLEQR